jgi:hypothetical protein
MKKPILCLLFCVLAASAFAQGEKSPREELNDEVTAILDRNASTTLGTMSLGDAEKIAGEISVAYQKYDYIESSRAASFMLPGLGQFKNGDAMGGSLFLIGDLAVTAGALLGAYYLLPANVRFDSLDYLNTPLSAIRTTWQSNTVMNYLPSAGVLAGGMLVNGLLRWFSAENATSLARKNIADGKVTFQPRFVPLFGPLAGPDGRMGMGMMMRFGY